MNITEILAIFVGIQAGAIIVLFKMQFDNLDKHIESVKRDTELSNLLKKSLEAQLNLIEKIMHATGHGHLIEERKKKGKLVN